MIAEDQKAGATRLFFARHSRKATRPLPRKLAMIASPL